MVRRGYFKAKEANQNRSICSAFMRSGVERNEIYFDRTGHMQFHLLQSRSNPGDTLVIYRICEICDTIAELFCFVSWVRHKQLELVSLKEPWLRLSGDLPRGQDLVLLIEQLYHLQQNGKIYEPVPFASTEHIAESGAGRRSGISGSQRAKFDAALAMYKRSGLSVREICRQMELNERTFYRYLKRYEPDIPLRMKKTHKTTR